MSDENNEVHVDAENARAGSTPHITRYILGISLVLVIIAMAIAYLTG